MKVATVLTLFSAVIGGVLAQEEIDIPRSTYDGSLKPIFEFRSNFLNSYYYKMDSLLEKVFTLVYRKKFHCTDRVELTKVKNKEGNDVAVVTAVETFIHDGNDCNIISEHKEELDEWIKHEVDQFPSVNEGVSTKYYGVCTKYMSKDKTWSANIRYLVFDDEISKNINYTAKDIWSIPCGDDEPQKKKV